MGRMKFAVMSVALTVVLPIIGTGAALSAQSTHVPTNPVPPPTVSPPAMAPMPTVAPPVVTAPTVSAPSSDATGTTGTQPTTSPGVKGTTDATGTDATGTSPSGTSLSSPLSALSLLGLNSDNALLKALNGTDGDDDSQNALSSLLGSSSASSDSATLSKILALLEKEQSRASASAEKAAVAKTGTAVKSTVGAATMPATKSMTSGGELVRLAVDGTNLLGGVTMIVSSILAKDGSFLLTGDRTYSSTSGPLSETFYFLCRKNADGSYRLYTDVSQPSAYPFSFLYRLARSGPIRGARTGDLIVFRRSLSDLSADVVIRVIGASVD